MQIDGTTPKHPVPGLPVQEAKKSDFLQDVIIFLHSNNQPAADLSERHVTVDVARRAERALMRSFVQNLVKRLPEKYKSEKSELLRLEQIGTVLNQSSLLEIKTSLSGALDALAEILKKIDIEDLSYLEAHSQQIAKPKVFGLVFDLAKTKKTLAETSLRVYDDLTYQILIEKLLRQKETAIIVKLLEGNPRHQVQMAIIDKVDLFNQLPELIKKGVFNNKPDLKLKPAVLLMDRHEFASALTLILSLPDDAANKQYLLKTFLQRLIMTNKLDYALELSKTDQDPLTPFRDQIFDALLNQGQIDKAKNMPDIKDMDTETRQRKIQNAIFEEERINKTIQTAVSSGNPASVGDFVVRFSRRRPDKALEAAFKLNNELVETETLRLVASKRVEENDFEVALKLAQTMTVEEANSIKALVVEGYTNVGRLDDAILIAKTLTPGWEKEKAVNTLLRRLMRINETEKAMQLIKDTGMNEYAYDNYCYELAVSENLLGLLQALPQASDKIHQKAIADSLKMLDSNHHLEEAIILFQALPEPDQKHYALVLARHFEKGGDLEKAFAYAIKSPQVDSGMDYHPSGILATMTKRGDGNRARLLADTIEDPIKKAQAFRNIFDASLTSGELEKAEQVIAKMNPLAQDGYFGKLARTYLEKGDDAKALSLADSIRHISIKEELYANIAYKIAQVKSDFGRALVIANLITNNYNKSTLIEEILKISWENKDYEQAVKIALTIPDITRKDPALSGLARKLFDHEDYHLAQICVTNMQAGPEKTLIQGMIDAWAKKEKLG